MPNELNRKFFLQRLLKEKNPVEFIKKQIADGKISEEDLLEIVCANHNLLNHQIVRQCVEDDLLQAEQLMERGINQRFLEMLYEEPEDVLPTVGNIKGIDYETTEVYFWGIPTSGKTCALGTIFKAARSGKVLECLGVETCQGLRYYQILKQIFDSPDGYCILPGRTPLDTNFAIRTEMTDHDHKHHPVTLIDMAGELFCAIAWEENGDENLLTDKHREAIADFKNILINNCSTNPKYHFFIIEYNRESRRYKDYDQDTYLDAGLRYLINNGVLNKPEDRVFVIVTKTDLLEQDIDPNQDKKQYLLDFLNERYPNFFSLINNHCRERKINGGVLPPPIVFSVGDVRFQLLCHINTDSANHVIEQIISPPKKKGGWFSF